MKHVSSCAAAIISAGRRYLGFVALFSGLLCVPLFAADEKMDSLKERSETLASNSLDVEMVRQSADLCEQILAQKEDDFDTLVLYSRVCWSLGHLVTNKREQKRWFEKGRDAGGRLKELYSHKADGFYWHGVNFGEWVDRASIFAKIGAKKVILDDMNKVLEINPKYDGGGAYIIIGRINYIAPGGSYSKAIDCYEKAIALNPKRTTAYLYLGELDLHEHIFDKAEQNLKKVLAMEVDHRYGIEAKEDKANAIKLLRKVTRKEGHFTEQEEITGR